VFIGVNSLDKGRLPVPRVWVLAGRKAGDNTQLLALAEALGWPFETKRICNRVYELLANRLLGVTLAGVNLKKSDRLLAPWPDLVLTAGRRNEPVARWIRKQSGGRTRLVHLGRPWAPLECFDLIITTPQYNLPERSNVLTVDLPLHGLTREALDKLRDEWLVHFRQMPEPRWVVLLGGDSGPFVFTPSRAQHLASWLNERVKKSGGSILVSNSARTPEEVYRVFLDTLDVPVHAYHWGSNEDNPYRGYLAVADQFVVTGESMSMLAEAAAANRPLYIFDLSDNSVSGSDRANRPWWTIAHNFRYKPLTHRLAMWLAPHRMRRDITRIQEKLVKDGVAVWAGHSAVAEARGANTKVLDNAANSVRGLFSVGEGIR
jgi:mitochondrial fission protein ELM1